MAFLGQEEQLREFQDRFRFLYVVLFAAIGLLASRLVYLQILNGDKMRRYSEENRIKRVRIAAPRGMIFDRHGSLLVDNRPAFDLEITPQYLRSASNEEQKETIRLLATALEVPETGIADSLAKNRLQPAFRPIKLETDLTRDQVAKVETWKLRMPGVAVETEIQRTNLYGDIGSHLFGYLGDVSKLELEQMRKGGADYKQGDIVGKTGIERHLEDVLRGKDGEELVEVDALGRRIREKRKARVLEEGPSLPAVPGNNLVLTIDQDLQPSATRPARSWPWTPRRGKSWRWCLGPRSTRRSSRAGSRRSSGKS
jgi:penicillin-binding protein 2